MNIECYELYNINLFEKIQGYLISGSCSCLYERVCRVTEKSRKVIKLKDRKVKMILDTSCDDQKVG